MIFLELKTPIFLNAFTVPTCTVGHIHCDSVRAHHISYIDVRCSRRGLTPVNGIQITFYIWQLEFPIFLTSEQKAGKRFASEVESIVEGF
jgi:hypothetical protein